MTDETTKGVVFKHEDETEQGVPFGPVWVNDEKQSKWLTITQARELAGRLGLDFTEV